MAAARGHFNLTSTSASDVAAENPSWRHSPVPYLFGGLAAMLGLIAFALLILACSYWRFSGYFNRQDEDSSERDLEAGQGKPRDDYLPGKQAVFEEKVLVIMAGEKKPTFLATPMSSRSSSFGDSTSSSSSESCCTCGESDNNQRGKPEVVTEDLKQGREQSSENGDGSETRNSDELEGRPVDH